MNRILLCLPLLLIGACATAPKPLRGDYPPMTPSEASEREATGSRVRWGGDIIGIEPGAERTCFEVLGRPLSASARPLDSDRSSGRFLACREGFYDPALFDEGREITVTGRIDSYETRQIGDYPYRYPKLDAEVIFLWPERDLRDVYYVGAMGWYHRPFWWGGYYMRPYYPPLRKGQIETGKTATERPRR